mgnify:CR=1 FL=1
MEAALFLLPKLPNNEQIKITTHGHSWPSSHQLQRS